MVQYAGMTKPPRHGRPPAGVRPNECVRSYPNAGIRLPLDTKRKLHALAEVLQLPAWLTADVLIRGAAEQLTTPKRTR